MKNNLPNDAEFYTTGELKKYWKIAKHKKRDYWFVWSKILNKWIPMYSLDHFNPKNLEAMSK